MLGIFFFLSFILLKLSDLRAVPNLFKVSLRCWQEHVTSVSLRNVSLSTTWIVCLGDRLETFSLIWWPGSFHVTQALLGSI